MAESVVGDLTPELAVLLWQQIRPLLKPLVEEEGLYEVDDILAMHIYGERKIWVACDSETKEIEAAFVTQLCSYPRGKRICNVNYLSGARMESWIDKVVAMTDAFGKASGCFRMAIVGREGWVRAAGYRKAGAVLIKEL